MTHTAPTPKTLLYEVSIIRPLVIFLLVIYHSLCIYTGGWERPAGVDPNPVYWWLGRLISGFRIETIAFVGGYVFAYQCIARGRRAPFFQFAWKKFKRLLIPCWIFGTAFLFLFRYHPGMRWNICLWKVLNGIEHLWFLPMLFWCFLTTWLLDRVLRLPPVREDARPWQSAALWIALAATAIGPLVTMPSLRLGLTRAPHFIFYFFLGYVVWYLFCAERCAPASEQQLLARQQRRLHTSILCLFSYLFFLLLHTRICHPHMMGLAPITVSSGFRLLLPFSTKLIACAKTTSGIMALYLFVKQRIDSRDLCSHGEYHPKPWVIWCSKVCYGTYVFHMFFMKWVVYHTTIPAWFSQCLPGAWAFPWLFALASFVFAIGLSVLFLKTKTGRWLIG